VDLTRKGNPDSDRLLQKFGIRGVPTIVFIDQQGEERRELRLVDFLPPDQFLVRMAEIRR
jgi:thiol:disulfide interchange protein DsbD